MFAAGESPQLTRARYDKVRYEESLAAFMREAWPHAREPDQYLTNWHIDCMCDYLTAGVDWQLGTLLMFSLPPGHMKSLGINVFLPPWLWAQDPQKGHPDNKLFLRPNTWRGPGVRMISLGYNQQLIYQHANKNLDLIKSEWYQQRWADRFTLEKQGVEEFNNNRGGLRQAISSKGGITGFGSHIIMLDDVHNRAADSYEVDRLKIIDTWHNALQSRLRDIHGLFILSMQRTAENDLIGDILAKEFNGVHVCLPYEFDRGHPYLFMRDLDPEQLKHCGVLLDKPVIRKTDSSFGTDVGPRLGEPWQDLRQPGDVLWPAKWPKEAIADRTKGMSSHDKAGQYQQRPTAAEGNMFKRVWFDARQPVADLAAFIAAKKLRVVRSWDLAWTEQERGKEPDWTVGVLMGVDPNDIYYVLHVFRAKLSPAKLEDAVMQMAAVDAITCGAQSYRIRIPQDPGAGKFVAYQLQKKLAAYEVVVEPEHAPKAQRAAPMMGLFENKIMVLIEAPWNDDFIDELCAFRADDSHKHDDQVDAAAGGLRALMRVPIWTTLAA